jgi:hypothetical protein
MEFFLKRSFLLAALLMAAAFNGYTQSDSGRLWTQVNYRHAGESLPNFKLAPNQYAQFQLAEQSMRLLLGQAPSRSDQAIASRGAVATVALPFPNGDFVNFTVEEYPLMQPELASKFPSIKAYQIRRQSGPVQTGRADFTEQGFHAMIHTEQGIVFIDPRTTTGGDRTYISYFKHDYRPVDKDTSKMVCQVTGANMSTPNLSLSPAARVVMRLAARSPDQISTYRLAVAATGEYTIRQGGTKSQALSAIFTTINRVNEVYGRDLAVELQLIDGNEQIIYTDPLNDPYDNDDGGAMIDQNQQNIDAVIGPPNYDIGHVFSTGGGGLASLWATCGPSKARGVTGSTNPIGDAFDIDYVAHELGHQFGANHTYNGTSGSCGGQREETTAFEPGSGSTIMAYAGICSPEDIQVNSDSTFHAGSIAEVEHFMDNRGGATCRGIRQISNAAPVADAGADYTIPANTAFVLAGVASDPDVGDTLYYAWDQMDLGQASSSVASMADDGTRPLFRSYVPSLSPQRYFPKLQSILNGTSDIGERLPTTNRILNFRLTVRDNKGGLSGDDTMVSVTTNAGPFRLTVPNGLEALTSSVTVQWDVANTHATPVSCGFVNISLSINSGQDFPMLLLEQAPNNGSALVSFPSIITSTARLKVQCSNNIFFDVSDRDFSISGSAVLPDAPVISATSASINSIDVYFTPGFLGSGSLLKYWANCSVDGQGTVVFPGDSSPIRVTELASSSTYRCKVQTQSTAGYSPWSALSVPVATRFDLITHYYTNILNRVADDGGKAFWQSEVSRMSNLSVSPNEAYIALALNFFTSAEFLARGFGDEQFVRNLYLTFYNREADQGGLDYWRGLLSSGLPRDMIMYAFMFSTEFGNFMIQNIGATYQRPEVGAVIDYYRGAFGRLPDDGGLKYWVNQFRTAQCSGNPTAGVYTAATSIAAAFFGSAEYNNAAPSANKYISDLFNAFMRRSADLEGYNFWVSQVATGAQSKDAVRQQFVDSPEFAARVQAIAGAACTGMMQ